jgi:heme exporter protein C
LTLATGSLWAHEAWGPWWEWDPRLTASLVLWLIYSGILLVRSSLDDPHQRARVGAVLAVLGAVDIPLVVMATRWFRGMHPVSPEMDPSMRLTLLVSVAAFTSLFAWLAVWRGRQLRWQQVLEATRRSAADQAS